MCLLKDVMLDLQNRRWYGSGVLIRTRYRSLLSPIKKVSSVNLQYLVYFIISYALSFKILY